MVVCNLGCASVDLASPAVEVSTTKEGCTRAKIVQKVPTGTTTWSATSTLELVEDCEPSPN